MTTWGAFFILILTATFAIVVIMHQEWIENQRLPLPSAQISIFFLFGAQYLVREFYGTTPIVPEQRVSGYVVYSIHIAFFSRKYIHRFLCAAVSGVDRGEDVLSSRRATLLLALQLAGSRFLAQSDPVNKAAGPTDPGIL